ncbi:MAG: hypothetical protein Q9186_005249 [Xanthomendoza sp. 1 TL-2023]
MALAPAAAPDVRLKQHPNNNNNNGDDNQRLAATTKPIHQMMEPSYLVRPEFETSFSDLPFRNIGTQPSAPPPPPPPPRRLYEPPFTTSTYPPSQLTTNRHPYPPQASTHQTIPSPPSSSLHPPTPTPSHSPLNPTPSTHRSPSLSTFPPPSSTLLHPDLPASTPRRASAPGHPNRLDKEAKVGRRKKKLEWKKKMALEWDSLAKEQEALFSAHGGVFKGLGPMEEEGDEKPIIKMEKVE